ncbi:DUF3883 domain-containing protein [Candidatus Nitrosotenuis aquarius]|uniref:DUF3883 domain-containing protein n=1 Tax=Candidatus Nitrosotenuis aquarius TaxID=1846278 RepID=UPI000C1EF1E6|nr:DUF3883 domain-containing protein [Candidatus Nitrosotenuis aquarius]
MLTNLKEINRLLLAIKQRELNEDVAKKLDVIDECKNIVLGGIIPDHNETISFCNSMNIINEDADLLFLTNTGKQLFLLNKERQYELTSDQKEVLIKQCFLENDHKEKTLQILKQFYVDHRRQTFTYSLKNEIPLIADPVFLSLLKQTELIVEHGYLLIVNEKFAGLISALLMPKHHITDDELMEILKIEKIIGKIAEKIVFEHEKRRLYSDENAKAESDLVQNISSTFVNAGYDINSFDGKTRDLKFNRFIEVKGSTGKRISFFLSSNEIDKAKELGSKYWIYFVSEIDIKSKSHNGEIIKIQNPVINILNNEEYEQECVKTRIHLK